eukprot:gb/GFBE01011795.1/.p1 GENE.gb/GFBE01011795.1/~~gb/GFBE01011795.1/.p1  ORF type:complete len:125 (+),score=33.24 gb/GFBE01011795.1/:1-375(+)
MARRGHSALSLLLAAAAVVVALQLLAPAFVQPKQTRGMEVAAPAAMGVLTAMADPMAAEALKGPLGGSEICVTGAIKYFIYPLCDPVYLTSPIYNFPLVLGFFATLITVINLILPETQPDEDLR